MDKHLDHTIAFSDQSELKSLYSWSLQELDGEGNKVGRDLIPWNWTLYFKARDVVLQDQWRVEDHYPVDERKSPRESKTRQFIKGSLYPDDLDGREPNYSMLGTSRRMSRFELFIDEVPDDKEEECSAYGVVSYTTEHDFRDVTYDDCLTLSFHVHQDTFQRYAKRVLSGEVSDLMVRVSGVEGFYSDWSPGITTDQIKILTSNEDHEVKSLEGGSSVPRLGKIREGELYLSRKLILAPKPNPDEPYQAIVADDDSVSHHSETTGDLRVQEILKSVRSLRTVVWIIAGLLFVSLLL